MLHHLPHNNTSNQSMPGVTAREAGRGVKTQNKAMNAATKYCSAA